MNKNVKRCAICVLKSPPSWQKFTFYIYKIFSSENERNQPAIVTENNPFPAWHSLRYGGVLLTSRGA